MKRLYPSFKNSALLAGVLALVPFSGFSQDLKEGGKGDIKKARTTVHVEGGRKVTITQVPLEEGKAFRREMARIAEAKRHALKNQEQQRAYARKTEESLTQKSFVVSAMTLPDQTTFLECWSTSGGDVLTAYSNCNWNHFMGQQTFQDGNVQYTFMLLPSTAPQRQEGGDEDQEGEKSTLQNAPKELPSIVGVGAKYMVMEGDGNKEILDFLESVHTRYDQEKRTLIRNFRKKKREAEEKAHQLRVNPPKPESVVIRFGRREKSSPAPKATSKDKRSQ